MGRLGILRLLGLAVLVFAVVVAGISWPDDKALAATSGDTDPVAPSSAVKLKDALLNGKPSAAPELPTGRAAAATPVTVPSATDATVQVPAGKAVVTPGLPAVVGPVTDRAGKAAASPVAVEVLDQKQVERVGGRALALKVTAPEGAVGRVRLQVDVKDIASQFGGAYAGRLRLSTVPSACAEAGAPVAKNAGDTCWPKPLDTERDLAQGTLTATVALPATGDDTISTPAPAGSSAVPAPATPTTSTSASPSPSAPTTSPSASPSPAAAPSAAPSSTSSSAAPAARVTVAAAGLIVIAAAGGADAGGDYHATSLASAGTWAVGDGSGSFSYSYPVPVPPAVGGDAPALGLGYDSGSVDGKTTASNGQSSWLGQGWDLSNGYVERQYNTCLEDGQAETATGGEVCWGGLRYYLNISGHSSEMIPIGAPADATEFRLQDDEGWRVRRGTGASNGETGGEFFTVQDPAGLTYTFGAGRTPWAAAADTNSVWNRTVLGDDVGEPCHAGTPAGSLCNQGWRWNLDRVVDAEGNARSISYDVETNRYRALDGTDRLYDRGGSALRMEYGGRSAGAAGATAGQTSATSRVDFVTAGRCVAALTDGSVACPNPATSGAAVYPDTPTDLICTSGCTENAATFFTTRRLWRINTSRLVGGTWTGIDRLQFAARMLDADGAGTVEFADLWLDSIVRTGLVAGSAVLPPISFAPVVKNNRVADGTGGSLLQKYRIGTVTSELGARTTVTYGHAPGHECTRADVDDDPANGQIVAWTNVKECYPKWYAPPGGRADFAWFQKYVVTRVVNEDPTVGALLNPVGTPGVNEPTVTDYEYLGDAAWHYEDQIGTAVGTLKTQSWSEWRGYGTVAVHTRAVLNGVLQGERNRITTRYFRGMDGDNLDNGGGVKSVSVDTVEAAPTPDSPWLRGRVAEETVLDGAGREQVRTWHGYTARRTVDIPENTGIATRDAYRVQESQVRSRRTAGGTVGAVRTTRTTTYAEPADARSLAGTALTVVDGGSEADTTDDRCTSNVWTSNPATWLRTVGIERTFSGGCGTGAAIGRTDHFFEGQSVAGTPDDPALTSLRPARTVDYASATATITTSGTFDPYGRPLDTVDGRGYRSRQAYSPATGIPTRLTMTAPKADGTTGTGGAPSGFVTSTDLDPLTGLPVRTTDANGGVTTLTYDPLQRSSSVRLPAQQASGTDTMRFGYQLSQTAPSRVTTRSVQSGSGAGATYADSFAYVDGSGREVQAQVPAPTGTARILQLTRYDDRGQVAASTQGMTSPGAAGSGWVNVARDGVPNETRTTYDWNGEAATEGTYSLGARQWQASYTRDGAGYTVDPPRGGDLRYAVDPLGRTTSVTELRADGSAYATTRMSYRPNGELSTLTTPKGAVSTYTYDWLARQLTSTDPDTGLSTTGYDANSNVLTTRDARNVEVTTQYDALNRPVQRASGSTVLSSWTYDTLLNGKGLLASSTAKVRPPLSLAAKDYVTAPVGYDISGRPTGNTWTIPSGFGLLTEQKYTETYGYDVAGHVASISYPAIGGLKAETVTAAYSNQGLAQTLTSSLDGALVTGTTYDGLARLTGRQYGTAGAQGSMRRAYGYDVLDRLASVTTRTGTDSALKQDDRYGYTSTDLTQATDATTGQRECYGYDDLRRLTRAFTTGTDCAGATANQFAGPDPYDQSWTFDQDNNLTAFKDAVLGGVDRRYTGQASSGQPVHAATQVFDGLLPSRTMRFDAAGNLVNQLDGVQPKSFEWDQQQRLVSTGTALLTTKFAYAADGSRLIRQAPKVTTVYLGGTEVDFTAAGLLSEGRRYYTLDGVRVAVRTCPFAGQTITTYLAANEQASTDVSMSELGVFDRTRYTPYGKPRGVLDSDLSWTGTGLPTDKGWLGQTLDRTTGLNALGARYYDSDIQQFTAPDPVFDPANPRSLNPYTYSWGNPISYSDPSGLNPKCTSSHPSCNPTFAGMRAESDDLAAAEKAVRDDEVASRLKEQADQKFAELSSITREGLTIVADLTGAKAVYDCLAKGDMSGCMSAAFDIAFSLAGAGLFKIGFRALKHASEAKRAFALVKRAWGLFKDWRQAKREAELASDIASVSRREADDLAEEAAQRIGKCSFAGSTEVRLADGTSKPIDEIAPGDKVLAADPGTGQTSGRVVQKVWKHTDRLISLVTTAGVLLVTATHPVWNATDRAWQPVAQLDSGDRLELAGGGTATVREARQAPAGQRVGPAYNLTVEGLHTYFVGAGVLVHNAGAACPRNPENGKYTKRNGEKGRDGAAEEKSALEQSKTEGLDTVDHPISADVPVNGTVQRRIYDYGIRLNDKEVIGVEVKGGSATRTTAQRAADDVVQGGTRGVGRGRSSKLTVVDVIVVWVPKT